MKDTGFRTVTVTKKAAMSIANGHPWVYDTEVSLPEGAPEAGDLCTVRGEKGQFLGTAFYSPQSKIRLRILSRNANDRFDEGFWRRRLSYALDYRKLVMGEDMAASRLIFGEADKLPGLTADLFSDIVVTQTLSVGMEKRKDLLFPLLKEQLEERGLPVRGVYERNDVAIRRLEGLEEGKGWFTLPGQPSPETPFADITENGIRYTVDVENGQKTGFFLDQKYNRRAVRELAKGRTVLDCFTCQGTFALNAAAGGAKSVVGVDISDLAVEQATHNAAVNGLTHNCRFEQADVFDLLTAMLQKGGRPYDFIILDPPAFTKSRKTVDQAVRGYKDINYRAMRLLPRGGILATCSCSHFMTEDLFKKMLRDAAHDASVELMQIEFRRQSPDHPILWNVPETDYLKFALFMVV